MLSYKYKKCHCEDNMLISSQPHSLSRENGIFILIEYKDPVLSA